MNKKYMIAAMAAVLTAAATSISCFGAGRAKTEVPGGPGVVMTEETKEGSGIQETGESQEGGASQTGPAVQDGKIIPGNLEAAREADQMIVVVGTGGCYADVFYYRKDEQAAWNLVWKEDGIVGRGGITSDKREGDGKTPIGTYGFTLAFGLKEDPGSILNYHQIQTDDYWVDDPASAYYNRLVNTAQTAKDWNSAENLAACSPYYNYALALDYNQDCVPGLGSAIFLHCYTASPDNGSAGCIRLPEERMRELLLTVTEKSRIVIAADLESLR